MNEKQQEIYNGLKSIGEEIASFYADGVRLIADDGYLTKSYLIAHIAREIDGGLRDVFSKDDEKKKIQKEIKNDVLDEFGFDKDTKGHIASILTALNMPLDSDIARQWIRIATEFVNFAHRHGAYKIPRNADYIIKLWQEYESLLSTLIGNYLQLLDRLDRLMLYETPTEEIIETLPNLLISHSRFNYFFSNLKSINWFVPLFNKGYFDGNKNPQPQESETQTGSYFMPYWSVLEYLNKIASENRINYNEEITNLLVSIIENIINFRSKTGERIKNIYTDHSVIELISLLPKEKISNAHFNFINDLLNSYQDNSPIAGTICEIFLKNIITNKDRDLTIQTLKLLLSYKDGKEYYETNSQVNSFWLDKTLTDYKSKFIEICGIDVYNIAIFNIREIVRLNRKRFDLSDVPTIEEHEQTFSSEKYECQIIYFIKDVILALSKDEQQSIIKELLKEKHSIFHRLALHTIGANYKDHSTLFWTWSDNPFNRNDNCEHELYELLKNNTKYFTDPELIRLADWIDSAEYNLSFYEPNNIQLGLQVAAYKKREWLSAIMDSGHPKIAKKYKEYLAINPAKSTHLDSNIWYESQYVATSPLTVEEIRSMNMADLIDYFDKYEKDNHSFIGPSIEGLTHEITNSIKSNPEQYVVRLDLIFQASIHFQNVWLNGLISSWEDNHTFEVKEILTTCLSTIKKENLWDQNNLKEGRYENHFIYSLLKFIEAGIKDDTHSFEVDSLAIVKEILMNILQNDTKEIDDWSDLSMTAWNTTKGMTYSALIEYSLKFARLHGELEDKWDITTKEKINELINFDTNNKLLYFTLGLYIPDLQYISYPWFVEKFDRIFPSTNIENWSAVFMGYLRFHTSVHKETFALLQKNKNYNKALKYNFTGRRDLTITPLVNHICIALCHEWIGLEDELIVDLLTSNNKDILKAVYYYFWDPRNKREKIFPTIKPLWKKIYEIFRDKPDDDSNKVFLGEISIWMKNIETIDEEVFEWLNYSSKYIKDTFHYLRELEKHIEKTPEFVANLLVALFEINVEYGLARDILKSMVERLYILGFKVQADSICIKHSEKGINTLRDTYKKYN